MPYPFLIKASGVSKPTAILSTSFKVIFPAFKQYFIAFLGRTLGANLCLVNLSSSTAATSLPSLINAAALFHDIGPVIPKTFIGINL